MKILFLLTLFFSLSQAEIALSFFQDKPRSLAKDFYISQYLDQNITPQQAASLLGDVKNLNWKLFYKFAKKLDDPAFKRIAYCKKLSHKYFLGKDIDCIKLGLTPYKATKIEPKILLKIADSIQTKAPKRARIYRLIAQRSFAKLIVSKPEIFLATFNQVGNKFRQTYYNFPLPSTLLAKLSQKRAFNTTIAKIVYNPRLTFLQKSILKLDSSKLSAQSNFLLGLNAIKLGHKEIAKWYFKLAQKKAYFNFDKDKALFWQYLLTKEKKLLKELIATSKDINIYTLYAYEKLGKFPTNIYTKIEPKQPKAPFDITDPFVWLKIQKHFRENQTKDYNQTLTKALKLNSSDTEPHVARLIYRYKDNKHYYLTPYKRYLQQTAKERQALIFALARQESRFIPTEVSYSYALGLMQFMPFVAKDIAKRHGFKKFQYEDMFHPKYAFTFANLHLDYLQKYLFHPLFIAYAYNGGLGYTKRQIIQKKEYFGKGEFEPFLSMELLPNAQARKYGKKVLANYVIYAKILQIKGVTLLDQLQRLRQKSHISDF